MANPEASNRLILHQFVIFHFLKNHNLFAPPLLSPMVLQWKQRQQQFLLGSISQFNNNCLFLKNISISSNCFTNDTTSTSGSCTVSLAQKPAVCFQYCALVTGPPLVAPCGGRGTCAPQDMDMPSPGGGLPSALDAPRNCLRQRTPRATPVSASRLSMPKDYSVNAVLVGYLIDSVFCSGYSMVYFSRLPRMPSGAACQRDTPATAVSVPVPLQCTGKTRSHN